MAEWLLITQRHKLNLSHHWSYSLKTLRNDVSHISLPAFSRLLWLMNGTVQVTQIFIICTKASTTKESVMSLIAFIAAANKGHVLYSLYTQNSKNSTTLDVIRSCSKPLLQQWFYKEDRKFSMKWAWELTNPGGFYCMSSSLVTHDPYKLLTWVRTEDGYSPVLSTVSGD